MNNHCNSPFNYNWNGYGYKYNNITASSYQPIPNSPLSPITNLPYVSQHYSSPSLSSGYGSEQSFTNSPNISAYLPMNNYSIPSYHNQDQFSFNQVIF
jgi:hypothetical protein